MKLYHGTNYSSAMNIVNNGIDLKYSKSYLDFGSGFYTTPSYDHAAFIAIRAARKANFKKHSKKEEPYIVEINYDPRKDKSLSINSYPRHSEKWGQFVLNNRLTPDVLKEYNIKEHNQDGRYDVCIGEIADGKIINIAYQVNNRMIVPENIDYNAFLKNDGSVYPLQYSFHTVQAISCITVLRCEILLNKQKYLEMIERR